MKIYLYIKQHEITGKKYLGHTRTRNPWKYPGSGAYWIPHFKKYGKEYIKTLNVFEFDNQEEATNAAMWLSIIYDIVNSDEWANQIPENALPNTYGMKRKHSEETKTKMSLALKNKTFSETHKENMRKPKSEKHKENMRKPKSEKHRENMSKSAKNRKHSEETRKKMSESQRKRRLASEKEIF